MNDQIDRQLLEEMTRFDPSPDIKNIMVTGGNGFIGSWIIRALAIAYQDHYNLISFDKLDYGASLKNTEMLNGRQNFFFNEGDITSADDITACLHQHNIDTIIHLAAQSNVDASLKNPASFASTNIVGTQLMLECAKAHGVRKFIQMSSSEAYGATESGPEGHREDEPLEPINPYGGGKAAAEMLVTAFGHCNPIETIIVRANNIYGPNQFPDKIIPKFIMLLQHGQKLTLHAGGHQVKRYLYAGDAANAFNTLLHRAPPGTVYNLGSSDEISNRDVAAKVFKCVRKPCSDSLPGSEEDVSGLDAWIRTMPGRPYVDTGNGLDCERLQALGWKQKVGWEEGLRRTVEWYACYGETWWGDLGKMFSNA